MNSLSFERKEKIFALLDKKYPPNMANKIFGKLILNNDHWNVITSTKTDNEALEYVESIAKILE